MVIGFGGVIICIAVLGLVVLGGTSVLPKGHFLLQLSFDCHLHDACLVGGFVRSRVPITNERRGAARGSLDT